MRTTLRCTAGLALAGLLTCGIATGARASERGLLGIHIWRSFRDVLSKFGQPTRIEIGEVSSPMSGGTAGDTGGMMGDSTGGGKGLPGLMGMGGAPGMSMGPMGGGKMSSMMGMGMANSGMMGQMRAQGGKMGGGMMGMMGPAGGGGTMGMMGPSTDTGGGMLSGGPTGPGAGGEGVPGMGGAMQVESAGGGEVTWVYTRGQLTYYFLFNKDGRVIQIQEFGRSGGGATAKGLHLGDTVSRVYSLYGWAGSSAKSGNQLTLDYSQKSQVAFQLMDEGKGAKVVGITVALTEKGQIPGQ